MRFEQCALFGYQDFMFNIHLLIESPMVIKCVIYLSLLDCDKTDAAISLVSLLYLSLVSTFDAFSSIMLPVWLPFVLCDNADPASSFAIVEEFGFLNISDAFDATSGDVVF